jgi:hypothetical protein
MCACEKEGCFNVRWPIYMYAGTSFALSPPCLFHRSRDGRPGTPQAPLGGVGTYA